MIQKGTVIKVADNSGAKLVRVYQLYGGSIRRFASLGDQIAGSVISAEPNGKLKKGDKVRLVIIRTVKKCLRLDGTSIRFDDNAGVIIDKSGIPLGKQVFGPVARELHGKFAKIISSAKYVI